MNESWNRSCGCFIFVFVFLSHSPYTSISLYGTHVLSAAFFLISYFFSSALQLHHLRWAIKEKKENFAKVFATTSASFINSMLERMKLDFFFLPSSCCAAFGLVRGSAMFLRNCFSLFRRACNSRSEKSLFWRHYNDVFTMCSAFACAATRFERNKERLT